MICLLFLEVHMFKILEGADRWTIFSMKLATMTFVIVVLKIWGGAMDWVNDTNVWWFVLVFVVFAIRAGMGAGCCGKSTGKVVKKKVKKKTKR